MYTFNRSQMKWGMFSGFIVGVALMTLASCAPAQSEPTPKPYPTYTARPLQPTFTPLPTHAPQRDIYWIVNHTEGKPCYDTQFQYENYPDNPSVLLERGSYLELGETIISDEGYAMYKIVYNGGSLETCYIVDVFAAHPYESPTPTESWTTLEYPYYLVEVVEDTVLRELCTNKKGEYAFNAKGFPLVFECIYSVDGTANGRVKYVIGDQLFIYAEGDQIFTDLFGGELTAGGNAKIRTDGAYWYYMVAGPRGNTYLIDVRHVEVLGLHK